MDMAPRNTDNNAPQWAVDHEEFIMTIEDFEQALQQSSRTRLSNQQATTNNFHGANLDPPDAPLCRFRKVNRDIGCALPGAPNKHRPTPVLNVGDLVPHEFFPASFRDLLRWRHRQINELSMLLNDDFEVQARDSLRTRRNRVRHYLSS
uniref:Uncharacterized protein n=1 Tax=Globisporangium ultimum (strain ATCC 200006 / CBS 805.95 / DAOM BR144) TaxID=431595 RepID=K3WRG8_GLOUD